MTRELFLEIIHRQLFVALFLICLACMVGWFVMLNLGLMVMNVKKISMLKMFSLVLAGSLYGLWIKQLLPMQFTGVLLPVVAAMLLWIAVKGLHPLKYALAGMMVMLTSLAGDIFILAPICSMSPALSSFLLDTAWGIAISTAIESFFPALFLFIIPKTLPGFKNPLTIPIGEKPDIIDRYTFVAYAGLFLSVYIVSVVMYVSLITGSRFIFLALVFLWFTMGIAIWVHFRTVKRFKIIKDGLEADIARLQSEKEKLREDSDRLQEAQDRLREDKDRLQESQHKLQEDNDMLYEAQDRLQEATARLEAVKNWLETDKAKVEEKARLLDMEKLRLEELTNKLESENTNLLKQIRELASLPAGEISAREKMLIELLTKQNTELEKFLGPKRIKLNTSMDREKNILNVLTGKSNGEILEILGLDEEREIVIFLSIIQGRSNREIAATLGLGEGTVGNLVSQFLKRYELDDRDYLLRYILEYFAGLKLILPGNPLE